MRQVAQIELHGIDEGQQLAHIVVVRDYIIECKAVPGLGKLFDTRQTRRGCAGGFHAFQHNIFARQELKNVTHQHGLICIQITD